MKSEEELERAKQFMPFAALKGYDKKIKEKEKIVIRKKELSDDENNSLDEIIPNINKSDMVRIIHYFDGEYVKTEGLVTKINIDMRFLIVVKMKIEFNDINKIEIINQL